MLDAMLAVFLMCIVLIATMLSFLLKGQQQAHHMLAVINIESNLMQQESLKLAKAVDQSRRQF